MRSNDSSDFYSDPSYWMQGLSPIATDNGKDTNFYANWKNYDYKNYSLLNIHSLMSKDLRQLNHLVSSGNSQVAIMFFSNGLGQQMLNQTSSTMDQNADETQELSNLVDAISQLKQWFQQAAEQTAGSSTDQQLTAEFIQGLSTGKYSIENVMDKNDNWLGNVYKSSKGALESIDSLLTSTTSPTSLANIWYQANINQTIPMPTCTNEGNNSFKISSVSGDENFNNLFSDFAGYLKGLTYNGSSLYATFGTGPAIFNSNSIITVGCAGSDQATYFGMAFPSIWSDFINSYLPSCVESQGLQTMLSGFDTLGSSAATLSNQYQSQAQYQSNYFNELTSFMSDLNNGISNASNVVNNNSTTN